MTKQIFTSFSSDELKGLIRETLNEVNNQIKPIDENVSVDEQLLNPTETVALLRISKVTLQKWMKTEKVPYLRMGRKVYFKKTEVMKALNKRIGINRR
ncbi:MAG: helix-turn-helix domain-containing protein [bacterium]|nr:helix-turn-helix domain-containing protein [bacterium]